jgi:hypothetical protein
MFQLRRENYREAILANAFSTLKSLIMSKIRHELQLEDECLKERCSIAVSIIKVQLNYYIRKIG